MIIVIDLRKILSFIGLLAAGLFFMWSFAGWYTERQVNSIYEKRQTIPPKNEYSQPVPNGIKNHTEWYI